MKNDFKISDTSQLRGAFQTKNVTNCGKSPNGEEGQRQNKKVYISNDPDIYDIWD